MARIVSHDPDAWVLVAAHRALLAVAPEADGLPDGLEGRLEAGFASALEALVARGLVQTPSFALLDWSTGVLRSVLRGEVSLETTDAGRAVSSTGTGVQTWSELMVGDPGIVTLSTAGWTVEVDPRGRPADPVAVGVGRADAAPGPSAAVAPAPADATPVRDEPEPGRDEPEPVGDQAEAQPVPDDPGATIVSGDLPQADGGSATAPASGEFEVDDEYLFGDTVFRTVAGAEVRVPAEDADRLEGDHDGATVVAGSIAGLGDRERPAATDRPPAPTAPTFTLTRPGSPDQPLARGVVIGRAPSVSHVSGGSIPDLVTISDDGDISRNHVRIAIEGDAPIVTDLGSKNGTTVIQPGKQPQRLRGDDPTIVLPGTVVDLGGGVEFTIREVG